MTNEETLCDYWAPKGCTGKATAQLESEGITTDVCETCKKYLEDFSQDFELAHSVERN